SPVIALTGGRNPEHRHRGVYQEFDDLAVFAPFCKFNAVVDRPARLPDLLRQAFRAATTGCPRPVHLEIAGHFAQAIEGEAELDGVFEAAFAQYPAQRPVADPGLMARAARLLLDAERPILVAGGGVTASSAQQEVVALAEKLQIPLATSLNAKGTIDEDAPLSVGVVGSYSRDCANQAVAEADLVFFIGSQTGSQVTNSWKVPRPGTRVIQLDIEGAELGRNYPNAVSLQGDAKATLAKLLAVLTPGPPRTAWLERVKKLIADWKGKVEPHRTSSAVPMRPERLCKELQQCLPANAILVSDTGHAGIWSGTHIELKAGQRYLRAAGSLGWGVPAAIGAKCACPDRPVVCFTGDGGFYYHFAELETAKRYNIPVVIVINDNHALSQEADIFHAAYGGKQTKSFEMWHFEDVDLAAVARALGCFGERIERPEEIAAAMQRALASGQPAVLDVVTDVNVLAPPPWSGG
ncbi:MAG: thiamine pyrophosphate-binding protein, partial [Gemmataceae bacterium]